VQSLVKHFTSQPSGSSLNGRCEGVWRRNLNA
jgi:hypothetical protein